MKCPHCNADFNPDSNNLTLPFSKSNGEYKIYHQECSPCNQIIMAVHEYEKYTDIYKEDYQKTILRGNFRILFQKIGIEHCQFAI